MLRSCLKLGITTSLECNHQAQKLSDTTERLEVQSRPFSMRRIMILVRKFGMLTVKSRSDKVSITGHIYWNCICDCGAESRSRIVAENGASAGARRPKIATKTVRVDRSSVRFGS